MSTINVDKLSGEVQTVLENYNKVIAEGTKKEARKSMTKLVKQTKATAPKHRPKYYKAISSKKEYENAQGASYLWYVKGSEYRLSHLLENGHAKKNGGRVAGTHFIKNATDPICEEYLKKVEELMKNG